MWLEYYPPMVIDRLAVWWLKRVERLVPVMVAGVPRWTLVPVRPARMRLPRWLRVLLQGAFGVLMVLAAMGYCYRYSLLGAAPGP